MDGALDMERVGSGSVSNILYSQPYSDSLRILLFQFQRTLRGNVDFKIMRTVYTRLGGTARTCFDSSTYGRGEELERQTFAIPYATSGGGRDLQALIITRTETSGTVSSPRSSQDRTRMGRSIEVRPRHPSPLLMLHLPLSDKPVPRSRTRFLGTTKF